MVRVRGGTKERAKSLFESTGDGKRMDRDVTWPKFEQWWEYYFLFRWLYFLPKKPRDEVTDTVLLHMDEGQNKDMVTVFYFHFTNSGEERRDNDTDESIPKNVNEGGNYIIMIIVFCTMGQCSDQILLPWCTSARRREIITMFLFCQRHTREPWLHYDACVIFKIGS